jgi:hypothetical protein
VWNFNNNDLLPTSGTEMNTATLTYNGQGTSFAAGSTLNEMDTATAGDALTILGGATQVNNGKSLLFTVSMTNYQSLVVTYATDRSSRGFTSQAWLYSTDGTSFSPFQTVTPTASFALATVDFSSVSALNNATNVYLEVTLKGAGTSGDNDAFDNIVFSAASTVTTNGGIPTPVPGGASLGGTGLVGLGMMGLRRRKAEC